MNMNGTSMFQQPIVERTRLRFPELAREGWLYLTNTYLGIHNHAEQQEKEINLCLKYGRVFEPREALIRFDLPAYGGAEFAHVVLPGTVPMFVRPGQPSVQAALKADFSPENPAWRFSVDLYKRYFSSVTHKRYPQMAEEGWMWVLDMGFRQPQKQYQAQAEQIIQYCMGLGYLSPAGACMCPELGYYPFGASASSLAFLVPVFIRPQSADKDGMATNVACAASM